MTRRQNLLAALASVVITFAVANSASAGQVNSASVTLGVCPSLTQGDREFAGAGPYTEVHLQLYLTADQRNLYVAASLYQQETQSDWTTGYGQLIGWSLAVAPGTQKFTHWYRNGAWEAIGPGVMWDTWLIYTDTTTASETWYNWDWWLNTITVNGDTPGIDINAGCPTPSTDSHMTFYTKSVPLWAQ